MADALNWMGGEGADSSSGSLDDERRCRRCQQAFRVAAEDLEFYQKISPSFGGQTYEIPAPTYCPACRQQRRQVWRNIRTLYRRPSSKGGQEIVSLYPPDRTDYQIYSPQEWWADDWDALQYGRDFDATRGFFEQFDALLKAVPRAALFQNKAENCEFTNHVVECKDCYMSFGIFYGCEKVHYSYLTFGSRDSIDIAYSDKVEQCYELTGSDNCFGCRYSSRLSNCREVYFSQDLVGCSDCILSTNLRNKQYCIRNQQLTKEEYERQRAAMNLGSHQGVQALLAEYQQLRANAVVKFANLQNCMDCTGDNLANCHDAKECFSAVETQHSRYSYDQEYGVHTYDSEGGKYEWSLEAFNSGFGSNFIACGNVLHSSFMYYSESCYSCRDCFGCVGLRNKQYCILNKQYSKEEYEQLVPKIIAAMQERGEWGEFFPMHLSPHAYNETEAMDHFPLEREAALQLGAKWQDIDHSLKFDGPFYEPADDVAAYRNDESKVQELLSGILKCEVTGRPFKLVPQEVAFYLESGIPIPRRHPDARFRERFELRNPKVLQHRQCMCEQANHPSHQGRCPNEFETTYAPDRTEHVYCESCYQAEVV